ncbi:MAG TPA: hypothetical protein VNH18_14885, partial [Bryobacteraceae bacterium]|nr:hypothetical protein [Bryobacteraceae bacterium]
KKERAIQRNYLLNVAPPDVKHIAANADPAIHQSRFLAEFKVPKRVGSVGDRTGPESDGLQGRQATQRPGQWNGFTDPAWPEAFRRRRIHGQIVIRDVGQVEFWGEAVIASIDRGEKRLWTTAGGRQSGFHRIDFRLISKSPQKEIDKYLDWVVDLETRIVLDDMMNMQTIHFRPGTLTRSDLTLGRFFDYMRKFLRAHPSMEFIR